MGKTEGHLYDPRAAPEDIADIGAARCLSHRLPNSVADGQQRRRGGTGNQVDHFLEKIAIFAATDLREVTIFGLGIMPYISASIVFQLAGQRLETN